MRWLALERNVYDKHALEGDVDEHSRIEGSNIWDHGEVHNVHTPL
jgi:hypothetical protein